MKKLLSLMLLALAPLACGGLEEGAEGVEQDAFSGNPNPCALGTDPNFTANQLTNVGSTDDYVRHYAWINDICPDAGEDRKTTIVDFPVPGYYQHQTPEEYRFDVEPDFWGSASTSWSNYSTAYNHCINTIMAVRLQRWDWATNNWVQIEYREINGEWDWDNQLLGKGHCDVPYYYKTHENYGNAQSVATNKYRVRTWAKQYDGSYATVWIFGTHTAL